MIKRTITVLAAAVALFIALAALGGGVGVHAATQPTGSSTVGIGTGASDVCLSTQHDSTARGTPVVVSKCNPDLPREQWLFSGGVLSPWQSAKVVVSVSKDGFLVLAKRGKHSRTWTYGPGHTLTTQLKAGTAFLTWLPGNGRVPWVSTAQGAGQTVYIFTRVG